MALKKESEMVLPITISQKYQVVDCSFIGLSAVLCDGEDFLFRMGMVEEIKCYTSSHSRIMLFARIV